VLLSFLKVAFRNIWKSRMSTFINLVGMSIAIGCCIVTFLFIDQAINLDSFHKNLERIYLMGNVIERNGDETMWGDSPIPLGQRIRNDCPQIEAVTRISGRVVVAKKDDIIFSEWARYVEKDFFHIFSFPFVDGNIDTFNEPNSVYITETIAKKYFGNERAVGQELALTSETDKSEIFVVKGVLKDIPENSSMTFDVILPWSYISKWEIKDPDSWIDWTAATYVLMKKGHEVEEIIPLLEKHLDEQREANGEWGISRLCYPSLKELTRSDNVYRNALAQGTPASATIGTSILSLILILLASFNYANNRIVSLSKRYREIGIRKVVGSSKAQLVLQFLGENILFVFLSLVVGILIARFLLIPGWSTIFSEHLREVQFNLGNRTFGFLLGLLLLTSLGAGAYPAFIVSKFMPVDVFKGHSANKGQNVFIKIMIGFQFALTMLALVFPISMYMNARYQRSLDWGYEHEGIIAIPLNTEQQVDRLENELKSNQNVLKTARSREHIGRFSAITAVMVDEQHYESNTLMCGPGYMELMGLRMQAGRMLGEENREDQFSEMVVNQAFVDQVGWTDPVGGIVNIDSTKYTVVGVAQDFHSFDFQSPINPLMIRVVHPRHLTMLIVKAEKGTIIQTYDYIKETYRDLFPDLPFHGSFQDETFNTLFNLNKAITAMFVFSGLTSLLIAIMGLFGLVAATLSKREKEIGVRKVLGASVNSIIELISRPIMIILAVGAVVAIIPGYYLTNMFLNSLYEYHIEMNSIPFVISIAILVSVALGMLVAQTIKSALTNPVEVLRNE